MDRSTCKTLYFVCAVHIIFLFFLYFSDIKTLKKSSFKNIAINTITVHEPKAELTKVLPFALDENLSSKEKDKSLVSKAPDAKKKIENEKKNKEQFKANEEKKKREVVSNAKPAKTPVKKNESSSTIPPQKNLAKAKDVKPSAGFKNSQSKNELVSKNLIDELQNDLSFLEKPLETSKKASNLKVPTLSSLEISGLKNKSNQSPSNFSGKIDASFLGGSSTESEFNGRLIDFFKRELRLPEYGEVKIKMKINDSGRVSDVSVLSSKNKKNEEYLKSTLLKMSIPWLNKYLSNRDEIDITVCFTNDL